MGTEDLVLELVLEILAVGMGVLVELAMVGSLEEYMG
jgi:Na+-translocating ferredoxin:NAD+ oxidoreductase RnfE subunit